MFKAMFTRNSQENQNHFACWSELTTELRVMSQTISTTSAYVMLAVLIHGEKAYSSTYDFLVRTTDFSAERFCFIFILLFISRKNNVFLNLSHMYCFKLFVCLSKI